MFLRGGIAKGGEISDEHKAKMLVGKQYATLQRAMQNKASGVKLSKAQKAALDNSQNIEDLRADLARGVVRKVATKAAKAKRAKKLPELVQDVVQEVVSRPKKAKITKKKSRTERAAEEDARMVLVQELLRVIPNLRTEVLQSIAFLSGAGVKARPSRMCGGAVSDLPIGQEGFDGTIVRAGARIKRAAPRRRVARGGAVSDLPIGQEGFVGSRQRVVRGGVVMRGAALGGVALGGARKAARGGVALGGARKRMPRGGSLFDTAMSVAPYIAPLLL